ncbi:MAG: antA/AntB antirepressor family protein [Dethiosulfatibacter sp.]|nr:antA/AntB antirepressor family protein [Dethiosulfatibacter sp.]
MRELINIRTNERQEPIVSGRELHEFWEVKDRYAQWFSRMKEYGFIENVDFSVIHNFVQDETSFNGQRKITDHAIKLDMAKELCMIQRTEKGKQARQYFIA